MQNIASLEWYLDSHQAARKFTKVSPRGYKPTNIKLDFSKQSSPQAQTSLENDDHESAQTCISRITDPLWQDVCRDLLSMMGPASVLKIWKSTLGEFSAQDKALDLVCETEETLAFLQQYDFILLGSLQRYFPALKQVRVRL